MKAFLLSLAMALMLSASAKAALQHFITVSGSQLRDGDQPFRFISWNVPNLLLIEDNLPFTETNVWRLPDAFELQDGLATVRQMGGTVVRTYSIPVWRGNDPPADCSYVLGPGRFNENAFRTLDLALKLANENGIRLIIPLVNNWKWQGGRGEYAAFRDKTADEFWTDPQLIADFEQTIRFVLTRTNTLTGVRYCDDKAILCWETGNELSSPDSWTRQIAACIKSVDTNHLVMDGAAAAVLRPESLALPKIDIVTTHHYPGSRMNQSFARLIRENWEKARGKKAYVVGEFGFVSTAEMEAAMDAIRDTGTAGGLLWSLRFHDRDGGFYWHSEPDGADVYKAFHWPGSPVGAAYDEIDLMSLVRREAFAIRGLAPPPIPVPAPPSLLPIADASAISWRGSVGAGSYTVERAPTADGPWVCAGQNIDESAAQYRPLFADGSAPAGNWYYRVRAAGIAGASEPSNVVGPVAVTNVTLVDDLADFSRTDSRHGDFRITRRNAREAKEDVSRAAGTTGDALVYRLATPIEGFRIYAFFPKDISDPQISVSDDGRSYRKVAANRQSYYSGTDDYHYWKPVLYQAGGLGEGKFLKIELTGDTQIGRVEIIHAAPPP